MQPFETEVLLVMGKKVEVNYFYDTDTSPFDDDGHGPVSGWTTRAKRPGERVLCTDKSLRRYYDWQQACKLAREEGWTYKGKRDINAAVQADFDYLKAWCDDEWHYAGVVVTCEGMMDSLWGVETYDGYHRQCAAEMADELVQRVEHEAEEVEYWASRDVITKGDT